MSDLTSIAGLQSGAVYMKLPTTLREFALPGAQWMRLARVLLWIVAALAVVITFGLQRFGWLTGSRIWKVNLVVGALLIAAIVAISWRLGMWVILGIAIAARFVLFGRGWVAGADRVWAANLIIAGLATLTIGATLWRRLSASDLPTRIGVVSTLIGVPAAAIGLAQFVAPSTPNEATAPSCRGASVAGGKLLATTKEPGVNARSGPGTTFPQTRRFAADCTLAFDGYCIGEATNDLVTQLPDIRWLILHRAWGQPEALVAAGKVQSQSAESHLGDAPDPRCSNLGGLRPPAPVKVTVRRSGELLTIEAHSARSRLIGFAVMVSIPPKDGSDRFAQLGIQPKTTDDRGYVSANWAIKTSGRAVGRSSRLTLLVAACLAPAVAQVGSEGILQYEWDGRQAIRRGSILVSDSERSRLLAAACRIAPDWTPPK
jgi:hypothetical protein